MKSFGKTHKEVVVEEEKKKKSPTVWFSLKKSLQCKSDPADVFDPKTARNGNFNNQNGGLASILTKRTSRSGCSRSIANLKDVIHGSKRHLEKPICSPRSIGSNELINPLAHEVILSDSKCELKITGYNGLHEGNGGSGGGSGFVGTLTPGTPGPGGTYSFKTPTRKSSTFYSDKEISGFGGSAPKSRTSLDIDSNGSSSVTCHKCGEKFGKWEGLEAHHLSKHAVTELVEGDSSRKIVEIICQINSFKTENNLTRIERVLKVHNMQKTLARFEEYREMVKIKASKLPKKHPRCQADGNELLRFYGTTLACSLGMNGSSNLCVSEKCNVCRIIRHGFSVKKEVKGGIGVFTTSTSGRAFESVELSEEENSSLKKALIVCRVIAGRVHRPLENFQERLAGQTGFDSLAGKMGPYSNIEELYLLNPKALLPCFVVICKP
ncbi:hypothetical protein MKW98_023979 [Papaver atlanticum]|uniref:C2H2-type domain-containing protein n=1 Tax=Papaver atlanticum TaxID=357466 RepID=A0AAD4SXK0_9MAGN|nr:hypothetical protein MKW98_023979 [Papaver atlanticum]